MLAQSAETAAAFLRAETLTDGVNLDRFDRARRSPAPDYKGNIFRLSDDLHVDPKRFTEMHTDARAFFFKSSNERL
jgi:hypothetical protein